MKVFLIQTHAGEERDDDLLSQRWLIQVLKQADSLGRLVLSVSGLSGFWLNETHQKMNKANQVSPITCLHMVSRIDYGC
jgi:hypothetical protein